MAPLTAGQKLRRDLSAALRRAAKDAGVPSLEFTEIERHLVSVAVDLADFADAHPGLERHSDEYRGRRVAVPTPVHSPRRFGRLPTLAVRGIFERKSRRGNLTQRLGTSGR